MYSYEGPVIVWLPGFLAMGRVIVMLKFAVLVPADLSHPLQTMVKPRGMRNALPRMAGSVTEPGSLPPAGKRPRLCHVFRPRFGGSYMTLWAPWLRSFGLRM